MTYSFQSTVKIHPTFSPTFFTECIARIYVGEKTEKHGHEAVAIERKLNGGRQLSGSPDHVLQYQYGPDDRFLKWNTWENCRQDRDVWVVRNLSWQFITEWVEGRDHAPTPADHRMYHLLSETTQTVQVVSERKLRTDDWKYIGRTKSPDFYSRH